MKSWMPVIPGRSNLGPHAAKFRRSVCKVCKASSHSTKKKNAKHTPEQLQFSLDVLGMCVEVA